MATSTRRKILDQWKACMDAIDNVKYHLTYLGGLAADQSPYINKNLPALYYALEEMQKVFEAFRKGL